MIIIMEPEATTEQINKVVKHLEENDFKIIDSLYAKDYETPERLILLAEQKRNLLKNRAQTLLSYYVQTFPENENEDNKIPVNTVYKPDNFIIRALRYIGF